MRILQLLSIVLPILALCGPAAAEDRRALVIGNAAYADAPLFNPVNDARAMTQVLQQRGFQVTTVLDGDLPAMQQAVLDFTAGVDEDTVALVYYAGHGIQASGRNYLLPVDVQLASERALRFEALDVGDVLEELEAAGARVNVLILDACRNNPFERRMRGGGRGLAAIDAARGTLIAYATAPGSTASDGNNGNGLYTEALLEALAMPGLEVEAVFKEVRIRVSEATDGEQVPWESSSLTGRFVFTPVDAATGQTARLQLQVQPAVRPAGPAPACDISGRWASRSGRDGLCSRYAIDFEPFTDGTWQVRGQGCPVAPLKGVARRDGDAIALDWHAGPCKGTTTYRFGDGCERVSGDMVVPGSLFCAAETDTVFMERLPADSG